VDHILEKTRAHRLFLCWVRWSWFISSHPVSLRSIFIDLPNGSSLQVYQLMYALPVSHLYYMSHQSHPPWFDSHSNFWWRVHIMKLLIVQLFPAFSYLLLIRSTAIWTGIWYWDFWCWLVTTDSSSSLSQFFRMSTKTNIPSSIYLQSWII